MSSLLRDSEDSSGKAGSSCHQCKSRRNLVALTYCTSTLDKKNKKCRKKFCGHCLKKFYKENAQVIADTQNWRCPSCRRICCCAACKRRKTKEGDPDDAEPSPPPKKKQKSVAGGDNNQEHRQKEKSERPKSSANRKLQNTPPYNHESDAFNQNQSAFRNMHGNSIDLPPVPTIVMPTWGISSPISTPLHGSSFNLGFCGEPLDLGSHQQSDDSEDAGCLDSYPSSSYTSIHHHNADFEDYHPIPTEQGHSGGPVPLALPHSAFHLPLLAHDIKRRTQDAISSHHATPFAKLYKLFRGNDAVVQDVDGVVLRTDLTEPQKVEMVADRLRAMQNGTVDTSVYYPQYDTKAVSFVD